MCMLHYPNAAIGSKRIGFMQEGTSMLRCLKVPMSLVAGLLLLVSCSLAQADEDQDAIEQPDTNTAYDQALLRFNTSIQSFPSWEAFKTAILAAVPPGTPGRCYVWVPSMLSQTEITEVTFEAPTGDNWRKTSGKGWRQRRKDRTFTEYRVNQKARLLLRINGVKPRFFFANTKQICEFEM